MWPTSVQVWVVTRVRVRSMTIWRDQSCRPTFSVLDYAVISRMLTQGQLTVSKHFIKRKWIAFSPAEEQQRCRKARSWCRYLLETIGRISKSDLCLLFRFHWFWILDTTHVTYVLWSNASTVVGFVLPKGPKSFIKVTGTLSGPGCDLTSCSRTWVHKKKIKNAHSHMHVCWFTVTLGLNQSAHQQQQQQQQQNLSDSPAGVGVKRPDVWISKHTWH